MRFLLSLIVTALVFSTPPIAVAAHGASNHTCQTQIKLSGAAERIGWAPSGDPADGFIGDVQYKYGRIEEIRHSRAEVPHNRSSSLVW